MSEGQRVVNLANLLTPYTLDVKALSDIEITGIALDSRQVKKGDLFLALSGAKQDGAQFIEQAAAAGAKAVLVEVGSRPAKVQIPVIELDKLKDYVGQLSASFFGFPSKDMQVIGVTGTNGKTSVVNFIGQCLIQNGVACGVMGTLGYGCFPELKACNNTTLDAINIQSFIHSIQGKKVPCLAMEVSSHGLDQGRVEGIKFDIAVYTNLSRDHLDYHQDMENYAQAKAKLFSMPDLKHAVINLDDPWARLMLSKAKKVNCVTFGFDQNADIRLLSSEFNDQGIVAKIRTPWGTDKFSIPLFGRFNLANVFAVIGVLGQLGFSFPRIKASISKLKPVSGRLQCLGGGEKPLVVVDYAHTPDALSQLLKALQEHGKRSITCVFGCGGDRDRGKRSLMLEAAKANADRVVVTTDNPRTESVAQIIDDMFANSRQSEKIEICLDRATAIAKSIDEAGVSDIVVIAGKGHETYQEVNGVRHYFNDVERVNEALLSKER